MELLRARKENRMNRFIGLVLTLLACNVYGKQIIYGSETETVRVHRHSSTLFRFDHEVKTIGQAENFTIAPADQNDANYALLSIRPRNGKGGRLSFILSNDAIVSLKVEVTSSSSPDGPDHIYDFQAKSQIVDIQDRSPNGSNISDIDLMKAMIRGDKVSGYKSRPLKRWIRSGQKNIVVRLVHIYTGPKFNGYIFKVTNKGKSNYRLHLPKLNLGNPNLALLSHVDRWTISKGQSALLRIVAKPTATYRAVTLPMMAKEVKQ